MAFDWTLHSVAKLENEDLHALAEVLTDGVDGGASVSFMHPPSLPSGLAFRSGVAARRPVQHDDLLQGSTSTAIKLASRIRPCNGTHTALQCEYLRSVTTVMRVQAAA